MSDHITCKLCGGQYWNTPDSAQRHFRYSRMHRRAIQTNRVKEEWKKEQEKQSRSLDVELASALEGYELHPGDEVTTRTGREFKVGIHGELHEFPTGSL